MRKSLIILAFILLLAAPLITVTVQVWIQNLIIHPVPIQGTTATPFYVTLAEGYFNSLRYLWQWNLIWLPLIAALFYLGFKKRRLT